MGPGWAGSETVGPGWVRSEAVRPGWGEVATCGATAAETETELGRAALASVLPGELGEAEAGCDSHETGVTEGKSEGEAEAEAEAEGEAEGEGEAEDDSDATEMEVAAAAATNPSLTLHPDTASRREYSPSS